MMEILFRGKRISDRKWVEGDLSRCVVVGETHIRRIEENLSTTTHRIDPETVCQYTGLTDKNGKKIFEGDILQLEDRIVKVVWLAGNAQFDCVFIKLNRDFEIVNFKGVCPRDFEYYEVIGNIFDNPELIGDQP